MQVASFITSSSGFPPANNNQYYITTWSDVINDASPRGPNTGDSQAAFVRATPYPNGDSTALAGALADQEAEWSSPRMPFTLEHLKMLHKPQSASSV